MSVHARTIDPIINHCFFSYGDACHWWSTKYYEK